MEETWLLRGECVLAWSRRGPEWRSSLPAGLSPVPGPVAVIAVRYDESPVGPYLEFSVAEPARLGLRPGLCVVSMAVTSAEARTACRQQWGLPTEVAALRWSAENDERCLVWEEREIVVRGRPWGPSVAAVVPIRSLQAGPAGPMVVPRRLGARVRGARVDVEVPATDPLGMLSGHHRGAIMAGVRMVARPARRPAGALSSIPVGVRTPVLRPEPASITATMTAAGRIAQLARAHASHA